MAIWHSLLSKVMPANIRKYLISLKLGKYSGGNKNPVTGNNVKGGLNNASGEKCEE